MNSATIRIYVSGSEGKVYSFELKEGGQCYIGRSADNDIQIIDKYISRRHLKILRRGGKTFITDLRSKNGTFVDGRQIEPEIEIEVKEGAAIVIGMTVIGLGESFIREFMPFLNSISPLEEGSFRVAGKFRGRKNDR